MKKQITIEDSLQETVDSAIEDVKEELIRYLDENKPDDLPCLNNDLDYSGAVHEIVDGSVPIYTSELNDTWYLHSDELEEAFQNARMGESNSDPEKHIMECYYFYLQEQIAEWYDSEAQDVFDEWKAAQPDSAGS